MLSTLTAQWELQDTELQLPLPWQLSCAHPYCGRCSHVEHHPDSLPEPDPSSWLRVLSVPQWNPEDKEFNCPCHGSCFSAEGKNLAGPATIDMSRLDRD